MLTTKLTRQRLCAAIYFALALVTLAVYWPLSRHDFINLDDQQYITSNAQVQGGLTWTNAVWAFKTSEAANWHPLTWISHMMDCDLYGLNPAGHHLTNLLFHIANTLLLFFLLNRLTGAVWRSFFVAALFAWHPLRVESVAWAAERKDVLSAFFWMLTLIAYARYAQRRSKVESRKSSAKIPALDFRPSTLDYFLALFFFACGLMSKPMVVTLPFVLLLLDFWPLKRFSDSTVQHLLLEKIPFLALAFADSIVTCVIQKSGGAIWSQAALPFHARIANALVAYVRYISKTFWPSDLAVIYPYSRHWPIVLVIVSALLLIIWSALVILRAKQNPYLLVGWFWFLGTLVPTIGLVQVGSQSMADRYMYLPCIGFFILIVWGADGLLKRWPEWRKFLSVAGSIALAGCLMVTSIQLNYWQDSIKLLSHTVEVTTGNYAADNALGAALQEAGENDEAFLCYAEAVRIEAHYPQAQYNLGMELLKRGAFDEACEHLAIAVKLVPDDAGARYSFGTALMNDGKPGEAAAQFSEELRLTPNETTAHYRLAQALSRENKFVEALSQYREALRLTPGFSEAKKELGEILAAHPELR